MGGIFIPEEGRFLFLFLLTAGLSLFYFTALFGRIWCGWTCPQTVFTEFFDGIGRLILGDKYGKKDAAKSKVALVHFLWIVVSFAGAFSWVAYFASPHEMLAEFADGTWLADQSWPWFTAFFTLTLYGDMAFVREQFCKYACPYARFQTVLMDTHSVNVSYDFRRGEPRRNKQEKIGDCTACNMCVVVCPTGIDIRNGVQVSCIACAKCVDACSKQMGKEKKESLVRYMTHFQIENRGAPVKWVRPRTVVYSILMLVVLSTTFVLLQSRVPLQLGMLPDRNIPPMNISGNVVRNFYILGIQNMSPREQEFIVSVKAPDISSGVRLLIGEDGIVKLPGNSRKEMRVIMEAGDLTPEVRKKKDHFVELKVQNKSDASLFKTRLVPFIIPEG